MLAKVFGLTRRLLLIPFILLVIYWSLGCAMQRKMLYPRDHTQQQPTAKNSVPGLEVIMLDTSEGPVEAWFIPAAKPVSSREGTPSEKSGSDAPQRRATVIFAHGNAELIDNNVGGLMRYRAMGVNVLLVEFRGYGRSAGSPSQAAIVEDFAKAFDLIANRPDVDRRRIVYHGRSIGGGVVTALASTPRREPAALVLESPFLSVKRMANRMGFPSFLVLDPFDNEAVIPKLECPVLIMHGKRDSIIPFADGEALGKLAKRGTFVAYDCDHNDLPPDENDYWRRIEGVLREAKVLE